jgi:hypothetical protein
LKITRRFGKHGICHFQGKSEIINQPTKKSKLRAESGAGARYFPLLGLTPFLRTKRIAGNEKFCLRLKLGNVLTLTGFGRGKGFDFSD